MNIKEFIDSIPNSNVTKLDGEIIISGVVTIDHTVIYGGEFHSVLKFDSVNFTSRIIVKNPIFTKLVSINGANNLDIRGGTYTELQLHSGSIPLQDIIVSKLLMPEQVSLTKVTAKYVECPKARAVTICDCDIDNLKITYSPTGSTNTELCYSRLNHLEIVNYQGSKSDTLIFDNITINKTKGNGVVFSDSSINNIDFLHCDFRSTNLHLNESDITDFSSFNNKWFSKILTRNEEDEKENEIRDGYRKFRSILNKQSDQISELYFKSKELGAYSKELSWQKDFQTKLLLTVSKWTNNHGLSWSYALIWLFTVGFLFYLIYNITLQDFSGFGLGNYFQFLNPVHNLYFQVSDGEISQYAITVDMVSRVLSAFFIYQFIASFRRFGKA